MDKLDGLHQIRRPGPNDDSGRLEDLTDALDRLGSKPVQNLPGAVTGESVLAIGINPNAPNGGVITKENRGYGVDLNDNGRYDAGQDAVLGFDSNRDGTIDQKEIERTNAILQSQGGSADTNNDGHVSAKEKLENFSYRRQYSKLDSDGDGKLSNKELEAGGAQAWVDRDRDGKIDKGENQSIDHIKTSSGFKGKESKITEVDPNGKTSVRQKDTQFKFPGSLKPTTRPESSGLDDWIKKERNLGNEPKKPGVDDWVKKERNLGNEPKTPPKPLNNEAKSKGSAKIDHSK